MLNALVFFVGKTAEAKVVLAEALSKASQLHDKSFQLHIEHILKG